MVDPSLSSEDEDCQELETPSPTPGEEYTTITPPPSKTSAAVEQEVATILSMPVVQDAPSGTQIESTAKEEATTPLIQVVQDEVTIATVGNLDEITAQATVLGVQDKSSNLFSGNAQGETSTTIVLERDEPITPTSETEQGEVITPLSLEEQDGHNPLATI